MPPKTRLQINVIQESSVCVIKQLFAKMTRPWHIKHVRNVQAVVTNISDSDFLFQFIITCQNKPPVLFFPLLLFLYLLTLLPLICPMSLFPLSSSSLFHWTAQAFWALPAGGAVSPRPPVLTEHPSLWRSLYRLATVLQGLRSQLGRDPVRILVPSPGTHL